MPRRRTTRDPGIRLRTGVLTEPDVTTIDGLPVTTAERTVLDLLADHTDGGQIADVLVAALRRRLIDLQRLGDRAEAYAATYGVTGGLRPGHRLVERLLEEAGYGGHDEHDRRLASLTRQLRRPGQLATSRNVRSAPGDKGCRCSTPSTTELAAPVCRAIRCSGGSSSSACWAICFHRVDFDVMNTPAELATFMGRISGSECRCAASW